MKVAIKNTEHVYQGFYTLDKVTLQFERYDGTMSKEVVRENFYRGESVSVLIYDPGRRVLILTQQFRYSAYTIDPEKAWLIELVAGSVEASEDPIETIIREIKEEVNLEVDPRKIELLAKFYPTPGGTSERISLYTVAVDMPEDLAKYGGKQDEHEDIKTIVLTYSDAFRLMTSGDICDGKTLLALQWLQLQEAD